VDYFLQEVSKYYEIVIWTAGLQDYADWVLDQIDPQGFITHRLYRQHTCQMANVYVKDLSKLDRSLSKTIIVDNVAENFQLQPENGIFIRSWFDDMEDTALEELAPLLIEIVRKKVPDIRKALKQFRDQMLRQIAEGVEIPHLNLDLNELRAFEEVPVIENGSTHPNAYALAGNYPHQRGNGDVQESESDENSVKKGNNHHKMLSLGSDDSLLNDSPELRHRIASSTSGDEIGDT